VTRIITVSLREKKSPTFHKSKITKFLQMVHCCSWMSHRWALHCSVVLRTSGTKHVVIPTTGLHRCRHIPQENIFAQHFPVCIGICGLERVHVSTKCWLEWHYDQWEGKCPVSTFCLEEGLPLAVSGDLTIWRTQQRRASVHARLSHVACPIMSLLMQSSIGAYRILLIIFWLSMLPSP